MIRFITCLLLLLAVPAQAEQPAPVPTSNQSVVIATGNTFQTVLAASSRRALEIQNNNATDACWVFVGSGSPTKATSILLNSGGSYTRYYPFTPSDTIQATCATTNDTLYIGVE